MRRALIAVLAVVLTAARAQEAFGQCSISRLEINGAITLCADGGDAWQWNGPNGFTSDAMCIDAGASGTYTLRIFDGLAGTWSEPCSQMVGTPVEPPTCAIAGPDSVCGSAVVEWCAPAGDFSYTWNGPGGFVATSPCVILSMPGLYTLSVADRSSGATGAPCSRTLFGQDCAIIDPPQPPPPGPPEPTKCPVPARWWLANCDARTAHLDAASFALVAERVDQHSAVWSYSGRPDGLCELLTPRRHGRPFLSARRQFAAVHANLVAHQMGVTDLSGRAVGLWNGTVLEGIPGIAAGTTLGAWVTATEASLVAMGEGMGRDRAQREECRRIRRQALAINMGSRRNGCSTALDGAMADDDDEDFDDYLSDGQSTLISGGGSSPFSGGNRMRWSLERAGDVQLDVVDLSGRRVRHLANGRFSPGTHEFSWDGRDDSGRSLEPGAYFVTGRVAEARVTQRLILLR